MEVLRALCVCASGLRFSGQSRQEYTPHTTTTASFRGESNRRARDCESRRANHVALRSWLSALGSLHLALCTWLQALGSMYLTELRSGYSGQSIGTGAPSPPSSPSRLRLSSPAPGSGLQHPMAAQRSIHLGGVFKWGSPKKGRFLV